MHANTRIHTNSYFIVFIAAMTQRDARFPPRCRQHGRPPRQDASAERPHNTWPRLEVPAGASTTYRRFQLLEIGVVRSYIAFEFFMGKCLAVRTRTEGKVLNEWIRDHSQLMSERTFFRGGGGS